MSMLVLDSPLGRLLLTASDRGLTGLELGTKKRAPRSSTHPILVQAAQELDEYFQGKRTTFSVPLDLSVGTAFQQKVWGRLRQIPHGQTWSYHQLAQAVGNPKASRAVGGANGKNPVAIIVPCHRVIAKDGTLGGYSGGLSHKKALLALEREGVSRGSINQRTMVRRTGQP